MFRNRVGALIWLGVLVVGVAAADTGCVKKSLGEGVKLTEATPIAAITAKPEEFVGKAVRIEGEVKAVCEMMGCWLELAADGDETMKVQVEDGVIVFPMSSKGKRAIAEGVVEAVTMSRVDYLAAQRHKEHEGGPKVDESKIGEGPFQVVHINGTGAEVCVD